MTRSEARKAAQYRASTEAVPVAYFVSTSNPQSWRTEPADSLLPRLDRDSKLVLGGVVEPEGGKA